MGRPSSKVSLSFLLPCHSWFLIMEQSAKVRLLTDPEQRLGKWEQLERLSFTPVPAVLLQGRVGFERLGVGGQATGVWD